VKIAYWVVAGLLALFNLYAGGLKLSRSRDQLFSMMGWVDTVGMPVVRLIGTVEVLGAVGLVLPPATGVLPAVAVVAAIGFAVLQVLATGLHLSRREAGLSGLNVVLIAAAVAAAWLGTSFV
jgi:hypothetical protein